MVRSTASQQQRTMRANERNHRQPRMVAPPPSGEFAIHLIQPFSGSPTSTIEIIGEPNRSAVVRWATNAGDSKTEKTGDVPKADADELLTLVSAVRGFPSDAAKDVYGLDAKLDLSTFEIQWSNADEDDASAVTELAAEQKDEFRRVVESVRALARQFAKGDAAH